MKTTVLKNSLIAILLMVSALGFSQEPKLTLLSVATPATVTPGQPATFVVEYKTDGNTDISGGGETFAFYLRTGNNNIAGGFITMNYPATNGAVSTTNATFTWPTDAAINGHNIVSSSELGTAASTGTNYEIRFFNGNPKTNMDFDDYANHFTNETSPEIVPASGSFNADNWIALKITDIVITPTAGVSDNELKKATIYVSKGVLKTPKVAKYQIYNINGALIKTGEASEINILKLSSGVYIYKSEEGIAKFAK